ncbi:MAG: folylpolyglutamate synthase/dihydrofolate synthase family protein [bacterium]
MKFLEQLAARRRFGMKPGLDTINALLEALGHPEQNLAAIHIAGTNGKGSVAAMCESVLRAAGYAVGRYTSPHLISINERFLVRGCNATDEMLECAANEVDAAITVLGSVSETTYFEYLTAMMFVLFRKEKINLAVIETGLGGRLDATNVMTPLVSVITRIGLDHCDWLGNTYEKIAYEKAGIIKPGRPVVCAAMPDEARRVIQGIASKNQSLFIDACESVTVSATKKTLDGQTLKIETPELTLPPIRLPLSGAFQLENVSTALATLQVLSQALDIPEAAYKTGLESVCWPGRFQLVQKDPIIIIDGAHNPDGADALVNTLKNLVKKQPIAFIAGFCGDKDVAAYLHRIAPLATCAYAVPVCNPRTLTAGQTLGQMNIAGLRNASDCASLDDALARAIDWATSNKGIIVVCGSLFLAGAALATFNAMPGLTSNRVDLSEQLKPSK